MRRLLTLLSFLAAALPFSAVLSAQENESPSVAWTVSSRSDGDGAYILTFTGAIREGMHIYDTANEYSATAVEFAEGGGTMADGPLVEITEAAEYEGERVFYKEAVLEQRVLSDGKSPVRGTIYWQACTDEYCGMPEEYAFELSLQEGSAISDPERGEEGGGGLWALIIEAILWGFAMLLTPCVFPMVPMTVSFFLKGSSSPAAGRFKAFMYGVFIVLLYTLPISVIILLTRILGGDTVTADIFNWLATHWIPNLIFFVVFMVFAASFFGAFEIVLPEKWTNKADKGSDRKGLAGVFFMALTLVLVSFSCTGPIVGTVLIKSTRGEFWAPMVTMLAFSAAFALPFTLLALFPSVLKKLKSGGWMNSVKVVLGFIEVALGFKFLSVADQTYHWGILDREVYLAIWITVFTLLGLYLLGKIRFTHDEPVEKIGVTRLALAIAVFSFVVYMIPGMFGAPLKALSGYLPPLETQDFVLGQNTEARPGSTVSGSDGEMMELAHGLKGYLSIDDALEASKSSGKPVLVDISGHGCVNCREMEARVWSEPEVLGLLRDRFEIVAVYTDDKAKLPESRWITTDSGKVLKDLGRVNSYIARTRFGVNAQPNYAILGPDGRELVPLRGYNLDAEAYAEWLRSGIEAFEKASE